MHARNLIGAVATALILAGCKTSVETTVTVTDLLHGDTQVLPGQLLVEVAACTDFEDSRRPSSSLLEVTNLIPEVFQDSEYVECFNRRMDSFASFNVPIYLDKDFDGKAASDQHLNIASNENYLLLVAMPDPLRERFQNATKNRMGPDLDLQMSIKVINDLSEGFSFTAASTFVNDIPAVLSTMTADPSSAFTLTLSDVSAQSILTTGSTAVLFHP